jgi:chromosome segregation ATPase
MCKAITTSGERCRLAKKKDWCHIHEVVSVKQEMSSKVKIAKDVMNATIADTKQLTIENEELRRAVSTLERNMGIKVSEQASMIALLEAELDKSMKAKKVAPIRSVPKAVIESQEVINNLRNTVERLEDELSQSKDEVESQRTQYEAMISNLNAQLNKLKAKTRSLDIVIEFERLKQELDEKQVDFFDRDYKYHALRKTRNYIVHAGILND